MSSDRSLLYLRPSIKAEPLFDCWYAHPRLIAPAAAAMTTAHKHIRLLESFARSPAAHVAALRNPAMVGGPFVSLPETRADDVRALLDRTRSEQADLIALAADIGALRAMLRACAGESLEPRYAQIPASLRGRVELFYDLDQRAGFRFLEALLYRSPLYREDLQRVHLSPVRRESRPLVLSTPVLADADTTVVARPFADPCFDRLFAMRTEPLALAQVRELIGDVSDPERLFTPERPRGVAEPRRSDVRVRYFGHACVLFESAGANVLIDPAIGYDGVGALPRFSVADLPEHIDYVLLTHAHHDHVYLETLLQIRHRVGTVVVPRALGTLEDPSLRLVLEHCGFARVVDMAELEAIALPGGELRALPFLGEHGDLNVRSKLAYSISLSGRTFVCVADSRSIEPRLYRYVREMIGPVDALFVGMESEGAPVSWLYGELFDPPLARHLDQGRRLNGSDSGGALALVDELAPRAAYVYALGCEPWYAHIMGLAYTDDAPQLKQARAFVDGCRARSIEAARLFGRATFDYETP